MSVRGIPEYKYHQLALLALPAIANEAAFPVAQVIETALLGHSSEVIAENTATLAAYSATDQTVWLALGMFSFLIIVVMAQVGRSVGRSDWADVGKRVRVAIAVALFAGALCGGTLWAVSEKVYDNMHLDEHVRALARPYYALRVFGVPFKFMNNVVMGVLGGYQRLEAVGFLSVTVAVVQVIGDLIALKWINMGLTGVGVSSLVSLIYGAVLGLLLIIWLPPPEADGVIRLLPSFLGGNDDHHHYAAVPRSSTDSKLPHMDHQRRDSLEYEHHMEELEQREAETHSANEHVFSIKQFLIDSSNMILRSLLLQGSVYWLAICAGRMGTSVLAAHQIISQLWMCTSYVVDGFADVGTMVGSAYIGQGHLSRMKVLCKRLLVLGVSTGTIAMVLMVVFERRFISFFTSDEKAIDNLHHVWLLLALMQVSNSAVFTYDGLLAAAQDFKYIRNSLVVAVVVVYLPLLYIAYNYFHTLLAIWCAKACLNIARFVLEGVRVQIVLFRRWDHLTNTEATSLL